MNVPASTSPVLQEFLQEQADREGRLPKIREEGEAALRRLFDVAHSDAGQAGVVAAFLLGLYNGNRFRFDLTELRRLDWALHDDCLVVLQMDHIALQEVHLYFADGGRRFEELANFHGLK